MTTPDAVIGNPVTMDETDGQTGSPRPQSLMLSFLGLHVLGHRVAVYSGSVIDVLARVGVSEEAVRATLARMVRRDLLARHRRGRKMYFGLTERSRAVLRDGHDRVWSAGAVNREWDGTWTLVGFSLPEAWRRQRHDLRTRLIWAGFGPLQNGLWIAPGQVDVPRVVADLGLDDHLNVMRAHAAEPTEAAQLVHRAFDTAGIAARYRAFLERWDRPDPVPAVPDDFTRQLLLHTDWLQLVRSDPHLPAEHLPDDWPAIRAEHLFRALSHRYDATSREQAALTLDTVATSDG
ncbi:PaaX family transcriptional regulator [Planobispora takensis]|uniref:PaaX family transcriptional regulator n=1 Tax=Planobispora takensis TaxID=1367882 RepID=UPI001940FF06|nr:PaaX family transcriptional regulator C-terminal domain-containing protein [Planobispora takensis]